LFQDIEAKQKAVSDMQRVIDEPAMGQSDLDQLNHQVWFCLIRYNTSMHCMGIVSFNNITIYQQFMCQADRSCIWCVIYCNIVYCRHLEYNFSLLNCFLYLGQFRIYCICLYNLFQTSFSYYCGSRYHGLPAIYIKHVKEAVHRISKISPWP
jgi:hypothetical protein